MYEVTYMMDDRRFPPPCAPLVLVPENDSLDRRPVIRDDRRADAISWRPRASGDVLKSSPIGSMLVRKSRTSNLVTEATSVCGNFSTLIV